MSRPPRRDEVNRPWTAPEEARLLELEANGLPHAKIAKKLDRSPGAIARRLAILQAGARPRCPKYTAEDDARLLAMKAAGQTGEQALEDAFPGRSPKACRARIRRLRELRGDFDHEIQAAPAPMTFETLAAKHCQAEPRRAERVSGSAEPANPMPKPGARDELWRLWQRANANVGARP